MGSDFASLCFVFGVFVLVHAVGDAGVVLVYGVLRALDVFRYAAVVCVVGVRAYSFAAAEALGFVAFFEGVLAYLVAYAVAVCFEGCAVCGISV